MPSSAGVPLVLRDEKPRYQPQRRVADHHRVGLREGLGRRAATLGVSPSASVSFFFAASHLADHHRDRCGSRCGLESRTRRARLEPRGLSVLQLPQDLTPSPHRPLGVVLVGLRVAEVDQQPVAQVLHHVALVVLDRGRRRVTW